MNVFEIVNECINPERPLTCWEVHRYLGSMLTFQLGQPLNISDLSGSRVKEGELKISLRNVYWEALIGQSIIVSSNAINQDTFISRILPAAIKSCFLGLSHEMNSSFVRFNFSSSFCIRVDRKSCMSDLGDKFELLLPDGRYIVLAHTGSFDVLPEYEPVRAAASVRS